jgi:hypothetical protein
MVLPEYPLVRRFRPGALAPILSTVDCRGGVGKGLKYTGMDCNCKGTRTYILTALALRKGYDVYSTAWAVVKGLKYIER